MTQETYFGTEDEAILCKDGYHSVENEYDAEKHKLASWFYDGDMNPVKTVQG